MPFVITLPDNWGVWLSNNNECYGAESPQKSVQVYYSNALANSLAEAYEHQLSANQYNTTLLIMLNGLHAIILKTDAMTHILVDHQGAILFVNILSLDMTAEYSQGADLLIASGIWPATVTPTEDPLQPIKELNINKFQEQLAISKGTKIPHTGESRAVETPRTGKFGKLPATLRNNKKLMYCLEKLKEISAVLKKDMKYADYAAVLIKIYRFLYELLHQEVRRRG